MFFSAISAGSACLLVVLTIACAPAPMTQNTPKSGDTMPASIIDPYLAIQDGLAHDSIDNIRANAGNIATAATSLGAPAVRIDTAALQLASAGDLADAREKFGVLSEAIVAYKDGLKLKAGDGVKQAFCPMAMKPWLQKGDTLSNPYYGSEMPTCGSFTQ
jgi:hypothetical protein